MLNGDGNDSGKSTFLCVMDAQPGWAKTVEDPSQFPREMATHISQIYNNEYIGSKGSKNEKESEIKTLYDILKAAWTRTQCMGGTRCTMLELHPHDGGKDLEASALLRSMKLRNANYHIMRP